jgi:hypothetical protein
MLANLIETSEIIAYFRRVGKNCFLFLTIKKPPKINLIFDENFRVDKCCQKYGNAPS